MQNFLDRTFPILGEEGLAALSTQLIALAGLGGVGGGAFPKSCPIEAALSTSFPQSVVELGAGVYFGLISRQEALMELQEAGYCNKPKVFSSLLDDLGIDCDQAQGLG